MRCVCVCVFTFRHLLCSSAGDGGRQYVLREQLLVQFATRFYVFGMCPTMCAGPLIVKFSFFTISTLSFRNTAAYPASQNWPSERRDLYARSGNRWDFTNERGDKE